MDVYEGRPCLTCLINKVHHVYMGRRSLGKHHESSTDALRFLVELMGSAAMFPRVTKPSTINISIPFNPPQYFKIFCPVSRTF